MKVYIAVTIVPYEDSAIEGVFDTREKARQRIKDLGFKWVRDEWTKPHRCEVATIEEHEVE